VDALALHMWEEHCVECAPPDCYKSCKLFEARADQKCARFKHGILRNTEIEGLEGHSVEIFFRRWAKLETKLPEMPSMMEVRKTKKLGGRLNRMEEFARGVASIFARLDRRRRTQGAQYAYHQKIFPKWSSSTTKPDFDGFYLEIYADIKAQFTLELVGKDGVLLRQSVVLVPGWSRLFIDKEQWPRKVAGGGLLRLVNNMDQEIGVLISALHLVRWKDRKNVVGQLFEKTVAKTAESLPKVKCVVFDLDNTLWEGVIGDDGPDGVKLRDEVVSFIHALDARGIICAVASKNERRIALDKIESIGLLEYLLFPQIHWGPKSQSIQTIAEDMNVSLNTFFFIDDNPFERREVEEALPMVRTHDENGLMELLDTDGFLVPITEQASKRRLSYLAESKRVAERSSVNQDVDDFLLSCHMQMELLSPVDHVDRCLEMIDRTNQFNISGRRYSRLEFEARLSEGEHWCWSVKDDFGDYGIVGYLGAVWEGGDLVIEDFVMSCRVAQKRVEECLFHFLWQHYAHSNGSIRLRVVDTQRNGAILKKLSELGDLVLDQGLVRELELHRELPGSDVIEVLHSA
jgi:FkbH-like protein